MTHPTDPTLSCDQFADWLADFLERDVAESTRAAMESHALTCDDCGPLLADLRKLRIDAANLPVLEPSRDLWAGIEARIETPVVELPGHGARGTGHGRPARRVWMGLAAAGLVAVTAGVTYQMTKRSGGVPVQTVATKTEPSTPVAVLTSPSRDSIPVESRSPLPAPRSPQTKLVANKLSAEQTFDTEISRLRRIVDSRKTKLDTGTVAVIEKNLKIIDDAIAQCRAALAKDPSSQYLNESLNDALDNKVQLLRTAATLPVRM